MAMVEWGALRQDLLSSSWALLLATLALILGVLLEYFIERHRDNREDDLDATIRKERIDSLESIIRFLFKSLKYDTPHRISLFRFIPGEKTPGKKTPGKKTRKDAFECVTQYSRIQRYIEIDRGKRFPAGWGIAGAAWTKPGKKGFVSNSSLPDPKSDAYFTHLKKKYKILKKHSRKFKMKPRKMAALVLKDAKDCAVAVLVYEAATKGAEFKIGQMKTPEDHANVDRIIDILGHMKSEI
jgi:hypothetical protein